MLKTFHLFNSVFPLSSHIWKISTSLSFIILCTILLQIKPRITQALPQAVFYVSTLGKDTWSGLHKQPNSTLTDGPFATIEGARIALQRLRKSNFTLLNLPVIVYVREGSYTLAKSILFEPEDSGTDKSPITYANFPGEQPIFNGGQSVSAWKKVVFPLLNSNPSAKGQLWVSNVSPGWRFNQLFLNGQRLTRSVTPNIKAWEKWFHMSSLKDGRIINFESNLIYPISNLTDAEVNFLPSPSSHFINFLSPIESLNPKLGSITVTALSPYPATKGDSFRIENTLEGIDQPGEWSLDSNKGKVYLWPPQQLGKNSSTKFINPNSVQIIAPRLNQAILMQGDESKQKFVHHITIRGLTFNYFDRNRADQPAPIGGHGAPDTNDSVIMLTGVENILIDKNKINNIGGVGIRNYLYAKKVQITNNRITNCGGAGVQFQGYPPGTHQVNVGHIISRNYIANCGQIYWHSSGISASMVGNTKIIGNHIENMPYSGILVGGFFTSYFRDFQAKRIGGFRWNEIGNAPLTVESVKKFIPGNVVIENNTINNVMQTLDDGGAIYLAGSHHNVVRNNFIHDCPRPYSFGIYLDMDELDTKIENNIVKHCPNISTDIGSSLFLNSNGRNQVNNNVLITKSSRIYRFLLSYGGQNISRNIFICEMICTQGESPEYNKELFSGRNSITPDLGISKMDQNLYWSSDKGKSAKISLALMRNKGFDKNSLVVNPEMLGFDKEKVFRFRQRSPLNLINFQEIQIK
jgi:hypothetical protein